MTEAPSDKEAKEPSQKTSVEEQIYSILANPIRTRIIEFLGAKGPQSFTSLKSEIKVGVGTLYYHISILGDLVVQGRDKRYMLSEIGRSAYKLLVEGPKLSPEKQSSLNVSPFLSGTLALRALTQSPRRHIPWTAALLLIGGWASSEAGLSPSMLFLLESRDTSQVPAVVAFILGWLVVVMISIAVATFAFGHREGNLGFLATSAFAYLPIVMFALIWSLSRSASPDLLQLFDGWLMRFLFFGLQGWSLVLLASALRVSKGLSTTEATLTVLAMAYLNAALVIVGGGM